MDNVITNCPQTEGSVWPYVPAVLRDLCPAVICCAILLEDDPGSTAVLRKRAHMQWFRLLNSDFVMYTLRACL